MRVKLLKRLREWAIHNPYYAVREEEGGKYFIYAHYGWNLHLLVKIEDNIKNAYDRVSWYRRQNVLDKLCKYKKRREIIKKLKLWN